MDETNDHDRPLEGSRAREAINRFRQLESKPAPLSRKDLEELIGIIREMHSNLAHEISIKHFIKERASCINDDYDLRPFQSKQERYCLHCGAAIEKHQLALYDMKGKGVHCLSCDLIEKYIRVKAPVSGQA
jgi:hypothetical protein